MWRVEPMPKEATDHVNKATLQNKLGENLSININNIRRFPHRGDDRTDSSSNVFSIFLVELWGPSWRHLEWFPEHYALGDGSNWNSDCPALDVGCNGWAFIAVLSVTSLPAW